jgi:nicotinamidase-related amidase
MQALLVVDAQNEFSPRGQRPVPNHAGALHRILVHVDDARLERRPIAWIRHHNRPDESPAFVPGSWGAELSPGCGPVAVHGRERLFDKDVYGAFTNTGLEEWLRASGATSLLVVGFYAHMCLSTSVREGLIRGFTVWIDPEATGARDLVDPTLGQQTADEVRRSTLLHLTNMGALIKQRAPSEDESNGAPHHQEATTAIRTR